MNYFAHGIRYIDRPYFLAGTAIPDWLNVADRSVRMRSRLVEPFAQAEQLGPDGEPLEAEQREIAAGVLQHLDDDRWFHATPVFSLVTARLGRMFRELLGPDDGFRPGFLGHIVMELLLDAALIERHPGLLDRYYEALDVIDADLVQSTVNRMARNSTDRLATMIPMFVEVQFLRDYAADDRLLHRLNQVMRRIKLQSLPDQTERVLREGRQLVAQHAGQLLPAEQRFLW